MVKGIEYLGDDYLIKKYAKKYKQFITYTICGSLATVVNLATYFYFNRMHDVSALYSNALAWVTSVIFAYVTNKVFVFKSKHEKITHIIKEFSAFIFARFSSGLIDMFLLWFGVYILSMYDVIVKILTAVVVVIMNYVFSKFFVFRSTNIIEKMEEMETELIETIEMDIMETIENLDIIRDFNKKE